MFIQQCIVYRCDSKIASIRVIRDVVAKYETHMDISNEDINTVYDLLRHLGLEQKMIGFKERINVLLRDSIQFILEDDINKIINMLTRKKIEKQIINND
jgi:hypothetical protein